MSETHEPAGQVDKRHPFLTILAERLTLQSPADIAAPPREEVEHLMTRNGWQPFMLHPVLIPNIGYVVPCREVVDAIKVALASHPTGQVIEIGAGLGYLSAVFQGCGIEVTASDISINPNLRHASILQMDAAAAMDAYPDRAVLMSWPEPSKANRTSPGAAFGQLDAGGGRPGLGQPGMPQMPGHPGWEDPAPSHVPPSVVGMTVLGKLKPGNLVFYIHGDEKYPWNNELLLLRKMMEECDQIGNPILLPRLSEEQSFLHIFRKKQSLGAAAPT